MAASALLAQLVEHLHGKEGVSGSSPEEGFEKPLHKRLFRCHDRTTFMRVAAVWKVLGKLAGDVSALRNWIFARFRAIRGNARHLAGGTEGGRMAADTTTRIKKDERRGLQARVPNAIADQLPDEGEFAWSVNADGALVAELVEITRKPIKIKAPAAPDSE
jgi:hypothetical protein